MRRGEVRYGKIGKKLGKLSLAILENFVEKALGEKFVGELVNQRIGGGD